MADTGHVTRSNWPILCYQRTPSLSCLFHHHT